jgi:hypothetical protein
MDKPRNSFTYMPGGIHPKHRWPDRLWKLGLFLIIATSILTWRLSPILMVLIPATVAVLAYRNKVQSEIEMFRSEQELEIRIQGGIPSWEEVYALMQNERARSGKGMEICFDTAFQSPISIPEGTWDMSNTTLRGSTKR